MLSLKINSNKETTHQRPTINALPNELLSLVLNFCAAAGYDLQSVISAASACRQFRAAAVCILFERVHVSFERRVSRRGQTLFEFLLDNPHIADCIKSVTVWPSTTLDEQAGEHEIFAQLFPSLTNLRSVRIQELDNWSLPIVDLISASGRTIDVIIPHHVFGEVYNGIALEQLKRYSALRSYLSLGLDAGMSSAAWEVIRGVLLQAPALRAIKFRHWLNESHRVAVPPSRLDYDALVGKGEPALAPEELHANDVILRESSVESGVASFFHSVSWKCLKRLSLSGRAMTEDVLFRISPLLEKLESLKLSSPNPQSFLFAAGLVGSAYDNSIPVAKPPTPEESPFLKLKRLKQLTLDGVSNALPIEYIATSSLQSLYLHLRETSCTVKTSGRRSPQDLRLLAKLAPSLSQLQMDIGDIGPLWHPTAIPGVDVAPQLYQVLSEIRKFQKLTFLRLFPPYIVKGTQRDRFPRYHQPLSDEQAVRIFRHLKAARPTLETLSIVADPVIARDADIDCFAWEVTGCGSQIILVTRQANKDYEQRQVWEGSRRLRSEIKRYSYHKAYLRDPGDWVFSD